jgi:transposase-like protein
MIPYSKISVYELKKIIKHFCVDIDATKTSELLGYNRKTINRYYLLFRQIIYVHRLSLFQEKIGWEIEVDESYFGARRKRWFAGKLKRWRWTLKQPVFWLIKRKDEEGRVEIYTEVIPNCKAITLRPIILGKVDLDESFLYSDGWRAYDGLVDVESERHFRVNHWDHEFSRWNGIHINGIENFWSFTKRRLNKFNGVKRNFHLHLKECEWRYDKETVELETELLILLYKFYQK